MHVFHPKVIHSDRPSSIQFLHSRHDPNIGLINGGYPQPLLNLSPSTSNEYRISEDDFFKWRREQQRRAQEKRRQLQQQQKNHRDDDDDYDDNTGRNDDDNEEEEQPNYDEELYKKHKANKSNSASNKNQQKKESKHKNHNYPSDYDSSNSDKVYSNYSRGKSSNKKQQQQRRPQFKLSPEDELAKKYRVYGVSNVDAESSNIEPQYLSHDPTAIDPGYYSTLPKNLQNVPPTNQDDIYSGLLTRKINKEIADKSKLLADINYSRKQQTKNLIQKRMSEE